MNKTLKSVHKSVALSVFLSGFSALIYEITWQRVLVRLLGGTLPAVTLVLAVFMGGLAVGAYLAAKAGDKIRDPLKLFSWLELALGAFGLLFPLLTTQSSMTFILHTSSLLAQQIFHADPIVAYASTSGGAFINVLLSLATFALLLIPTIAMGATFPLCARAVEQLAEHESTSELESGQNGQAVTDEISLLYFINLSGAAFGSILSAFILLPGIGVADTIRAAAAINLLTSLILLLTHRFMSMSLSPTGESVTEQVAAPPPANPLVDHSLPGRITTMCLVAAVFSAIALALQVTWVRLFALLFGASTYAVAAVIASCLMGLAGGSALARSFLLRHIRFRLLVSGSAAIASLLLAVDMAMVGHLAWWLPHLELRMAQALPAVASYMLSRCLLIFIFTVPQSIVLGTVTPFLLGRLVRHGHRTAWITGKLMFATTIGSIIGAVGAGCIVIPHTELFGAIPPLTPISGMQNMLILASVVEALIAAAAIANVLRDAGDDEHAGISVRELRKSKGLIVAIAAASGCGMALAVFHPAWNTQALSSGVSSVPIATLLTLNNKQLRSLITGRNSAQIFYKEGSSSTVTVGKVMDKNIIYLKNDGKVEAALPINPGLAAPTSDERTQVMLGVLPPIICPTKPTETFLIGFGTGTTAGAILRSPDVEKLVIAELEPSIYTASSFFESVNNRPLRPDWKQNQKQNQNGRVLATVADARNLLALSKESFQLIISQPAEPWTTGSADLYSLEFWRLVKSKLQDNGLFCQWLQLYAMDPNELAVILRTFTAVFPNTYLFHAPHAGEVILVGFESNDTRINADSVWKRLQAFPDKRVLAKIGIDTSQDLLDMIIGIKDSIRTFCETQGSLTHDRRFNTDNNLITEYTFPTTVYTARDTITNNLHALGRVTPIETTRHIASADDLGEQLHAQSSKDFASGDLEQALINSRKSIIAAPSCGKCYMQLARVQFAQHNYREAKQSLERLLDLDPDSFEARILLGKTLYALNDVAGALRQFKLAGFIDPDVIEPNVAVASVYVLAKDWNSARLNWEILRKRASYAPQVKVLGFLVLNGSGDHKQAQALLAEMPEKDAASPELRLTEQVKLWLAAE